MTRKDFVLIAEVVASIDDTPARDIVANLFVPMLSGQNPHFDSERFIAHVEKTASELSVSK